TRSGNLLTPLMLGIVAGTFICGQATLRLRSYKIPSMAGSVLITAGTILFARMNGSTRPPDVLLAMIAAGLGMGLLLPAYTVAVQNSAPQRHMGIATASATFFRSIGSTIGVAIFGSILLTNYHATFDGALPPGVPRESMAAFDNPLLLLQMRPMLERIFSHIENGPALLQGLYAKTAVALLVGIQQIFLISALLMV